MTHLFISHSENDRTIAHGLAEKLKSKGFDVFLDFSHNYGVLGGSEWETAILDSIRQCSAVLLCCTPNAFTSQWCFAEVMVARYEGKRVFPLIFSGSDENMWEFLKTKLQHIDFTIDPDRGYERLFFALNESGYAPSTLGAITNRPPYPGLQPLTAEDSVIFFARRQDVDAIIELLQPRPGNVQRKMLTIMGPSGSGKTSMINAGLIPRLRKGSLPGSSDWIYINFSPGAAPFRQLAEALRREVPSLGTVRTIEKALTEDDDGLDYTIADVLSISKPHSFLVLAIDQFEELITRCEEVVALGFLQALVKVHKQTSGSSSRVLILPSVRADFYSAFLEKFEEATEIFQENYTVGPLPSHRLKEVIEYPAQLAGIKIEQTLVQQILSDAGTSDALPLLSFVLRSMYDIMPLDSRTFSPELYEQVGGLQGALGLYAERIYASLTNETGDALINCILQNMVAISVDGKATRKRASREVLSLSCLSGIEKFIEGRLLIATEEEGNPTVEVTHEAIFRNWNRLAEAIAKETAIAQYLRQALQQGLADWQQLHVYLGREQRKLLVDNVDKLALDSSQLDLVFRSSVYANDKLEYWYQRHVEESTKTHSIIREIILEGDATSQHHLMSFLEKLTIQNHQEYPEIVSLGTDSKYPSLRRQSRRILSRISGEYDEKKILIPSDFVQITSGECIVGNSKEPVQVSDFELSKYLVTNLEYMSFVIAMNHRSPGHWSADLDLGFKTEHPVVYISFDDAIAYCRWLSTISEYNYRLPSEIEWEKAASWDAEKKVKRNYPWGDDYTGGKCNVWEEAIGDTTPVGQYEPHDGNSYYGISDVAGNVWEWTSSLGRNSKGELFEYPPVGQDDRDSLEIWGPRVQKGGTFIAGKEFATSTFRLINLPDLALQDFGFRLVRYK